MRYLTLDAIKAHLNITHDLDDRYLQDIGEAAEMTVENDIEQKLENVLENGQLPAPLLHAMKLEAGTLYANRESVSFAQGHAVPLAYERLITPYRHINGPTE